MTEKTPSAAGAPTAPAAPRLTSLIIRPWPKVVFFYPTFIASTIFAIISAFSDAGNTVGVENIGTIWMVVFAINLLVFSFDFSRIKSITLLMSVIAIVLGVGWAHSQWGWFSGLGDLIHKVDPRMTTQFYGLLSVFLAICLLIVFINTRFNYYEINHREVLHHHGYLGDITRTPTSGMHVNKEIGDLMEYLLLRSGRLIFHPAGSARPVVVDNVMNVNRVEDHIKDLLSVVAVRVDTGPETQHEY